MKFFDAWDVVLQKMEGTKAKENPQSTPTKYSSCCSTPLVWNHIAWDLSPQGYLVWFGWWKCTCCGKTFGSRDHLQMRYFRFPKTLQKAVPTVI